jgi:hypothetical protein
MRLFEKRTDVDVLITTDEEKGRSTAGNVPDALFAGYNSIVELDRAGNDFVHYDLADDKLENAYKEFAPLSFGSFSDICFIDEDALKCGCINVGIGYQLSHSTNSYVEVDSLTKAWKGINSFLNKYSSIKFDKPVKKYSKYGPSKYDYWGSYEYDYSGFPKGKETSSSVSIVEKCLGCGIELLKSEEEEGMCCLCQDIDYRYKASFRHF